jgi:hypothetical protein
MISTGSSTVTTRTGRWIVISSTRDASVVVFPPPGPAATSARTGAGPDQLAHTGRQSQAVERGRCRRHQVQRDRHAAPVLADVDAVARAGRRRQHHRDVAVTFQDVAPPIVEQRHRQVVEEVVRQRHPFALVVEGAQLAVDAEDRLQPRLKMDVGSAQVTRRRQRPIEQGVHAHRS